eukprot:CAMPEP_0197648676 /NCGR_PEP_ID=MMETSP1338-20131121/27900_1 /TAXON_ID=43686 ORGANISM="Pelagodinium beii, Strain RCC1491" /NCGR_SAMPLE_ID=MMETSP1338 /ASSEMBLY_ACC=CAM_ASM_000754 /LENGTH=186 /DNA_ID=CAMNT_0043222723 /DNA_START=71 /DNA_END=631 /DNA_ORIENTATION=-
MTSGTAIWIFTVLASLVGSEASSWVDMTGKSGDEGRGSLAIATNSDIDTTMSSLKDMLHQVKSEVLGKLKEVEAKTKGDIEEASKKSEGAFSELRQKFEVKVSDLGHKVAEQHVAVWHGTTGRCCCAQDESVGCKWVERVSTEPVSHHCPAHMRDYLHQPMMTKDYLVLASSSKSCAVSAGMEYKG